MVLRIISLNVRGLGNQTKRRAIFNYYRTRSDILCLQETHGTEKDYKIWRNEWGGRLFLAKGSSNSKGVTILVNARCSLEIESLYNDNEGRVIICECKNKNMSFVLCCLYAPNEDNPSFFQGVHE